MKLWKSTRPGDAVIEGRGFWRSGYYPVPAAEDTIGMTSSSKVVLDRDPREVQQLVDLTFRSIQSTSERVKNEAMARMKEERLRALDHFVTNYIRHS